MGLRLVVLAFSLLRLTARNGNKRLATEITNSDVISMTKAGNCDKQSSSRSSVGR